VAIKLLEQPTCAASVSGPQCLCYIMYAKLVIHLTSAFLSTTCHLEIIFRSAPTCIFLCYLVSTGAFRPGPVGYTSKVGILAYTDDVQMVALKDFYHTATILGAG
jgi:hypothetical protein